MKLRLNCDLGESDDTIDSGVDAAVMPHIHQANIACGFHAGGPDVMMQTLALAKNHEVEVGAHPSYAHRESFGRRSLNLSADEITAMLHYQVAALDGMASSVGVTLQYIKPHGALYNDMLADANTRRAVMVAVATYQRDLPLVMLATARADQHRREASAAGITLRFEAFADRAYSDEGSLVPRSAAGAVLSHEAMMNQVAQLIREHSVTTLSGNTLQIAADTLCVHGDNPQGVAAIAAIRELLDDH